MTWLTWPVRIVAFLLWFAWLVVRTNAVVLRDALTRGQDSTPGIARYDSRCRTDAEITLLSTCITLTPGTLTVGHHTPEESDVGHTIYVHGMYSPDADHLRAELRDIEGRLLSAIRREGGPS
ncbi:Na+/H+ antiporter subunit E [Demequina aestuarii]|uniref:Na+/H+ antiporter subunit E n=1 Tax=Demequina aestuarii TaxID=327095 RepID=UPI000782736B|nr:Na+/H+ antiporter subunit E [Demequina aestuarii]